MEILLFGICLFKLDFTTIPCQFPPVENCVHQTSYGIFLRLLIPKWLCSPLTIIWHSIPNLPVSPMGKKVF